MENETYKIIKIIDDYKVVINAGRDKGIRAGTKFEIFTGGVELIDDSTGESYGTLDYIKGVVEAIAIMPKVSVCENVETYEETTSPFFSQKTLSSLAALSPQTTEFIKPLKVEQTQITGYGFKTDKVIRLGDLVRERD